MLARTLALACATTLAAVLTFFAPAQARACTCGGPDYPQSFEKAAYVFRGTVTAWDDRIAQFAVEGYYKGEGPAQVGIRGTGVGMCQREFEVGAAYLVFVEENLAVGFCDATFMLQDDDNDFGRTPEELDEILGKLKVDAPKPPSPGDALQPPPYEPTAEEKFMQDGWKEEAEAPTAKGEPAPAESPKPTKAPDPKPEATGCMNQLTPNPSPISLLLLTLITRRRRRS